MFPIVSRLTVVLLLLPALSWDAASDELQRQLQALSSLRAQFVQTVYNPQGKLVETSQGLMYMQRPGKFRWDYQKPYAQLIVADGAKVWHYDSDLAQVTVKRLDQTLGESPLAVLSGTTPLERTYKVSDQGTQQQLHWYELQPKQSEQGEFQRLRLGFRGEELSVLELHDAFAQLTRLELSKVERNLSLEASLFQFTPPAGVDVVGEP